LFCQQDAEDAPARAADQSHHRRLADEQRGNAGTRQPQRAQDADLAAMPDHRIGDRVVHQQQPDQQADPAQCRQVQLKGPDHALHLLVAMGRAMDRQRRRQQRRDCPGDLFDGTGRIRDQIDPVQFADRAEQRLRRGDIHDRQMLPGRPDPGARLDHSAHHQPVRRGPDQQVQRTSFSKRPFGGQSRADEHRVRLQQRIERRLRPGVGFQAEVSVIGGFEEVQPHHHQRFTAMRSRRDLRVLLHHRRGGHHARLVPQRGDHALIQAQFAARDLQGGPAGHRQHGLLEGAEHLHIRRTDGDRHRHAQRDAQHGHHRADGPFHHVGTGDHVEGLQHPGSRGFSNAAYLPIKKRVLE
jgi:hypothetical protein